MTEGEKGGRRGTSLQQKASCRVMTRTERTRDEGVQICKWNDGENCTEGWRDAAIKEGECGRKEERENLILNSCTCTAVPESMITSKVSRSREHIQMSLRG